MSVMEPKKNSPKPWSQIWQQFVVLKSQKLQTGHSLHVKQLFGSHVRRKYFLSSNYKSKHHRHYWKYAWNWLLLSEDIIECFRKINIICTEKNLILTQVWQRICDHVELFLFWESLRTFGMPWYFKWKLDSLCHEITTGLWLLLPVRWWLKTNHRKYHRSMASPKPQWKQVEWADGEFTRGLRTLTWYTLNPAHTLF